MASLSERVRATHSAAVDAQFSAGRAIELARAWKLPTPVTDDPVVFTVCACCARYVARPVTVASEYWCSDCATQHGAGYGGEL